MEYAIALEELARADEALEIYQDILNKNSEYAPALFRTGFIYLNRDDEKGIELVRSAMEKDSDFIDVGAQILVLVAHKGIGGLLAQVEIEAANGQVHRGQAPGGGVGLLPVDGHVAALAAVRLALVVTEPSFFALPGAAEKVSHGRPAFFTTKVFAYYGGSRKVDGVYDKDPRKHADARRYNTVTLGDALKQDLKVMDSTAFALCRDNEMRMVVFDMTHPGNIQRVVCGELVGTTIVNDDQVTQFS
mgnify:CR=1 FL=1